MIIKGGKNIFLISIIFLSSIIIVVNIVIYWYLSGFIYTIHGGVSNTANISLFVEGDSVAPLISIIDPANTSYTAHRIQLLYTVSEDTALSSCWYSLDSGLTNVTIVCGNNITGITSSSGSNKWTVYSNDTRGNLNFSSVTFVVSIAAADTGSGAGGGGGGGVDQTTTRDFDVIPSEINIVAIAGEAINRDLIIKNIGKSNLTLNAEVSGISDMASLDNILFRLKPGEERTINLKIKIPESGVYAGKIVFGSGNIRKEVLVLINVRSEKKLFDVSISLPESNKLILIGDNLNAFVSLTQVGPPTRLDVTARYIIKDFNGNLITKSEDTFSVYQAKSFIKEFDTSNLPEGDYVVGIELVYPGGFASSSAHFVVYKRKALNYRIIILGVLFILAVIAIIYAILKYKRAENNRKRRKNEI